MRTYTFSNQRYCKHCGFTNRLFYTQNKINGKKMIWVSKECKECYLERRRKQDREYRKKESYKIYQKKYHMVNIDKLRPQATLRRWKFRKKQKENRLRERNRDLLFYKGLNEKNQTTLS